MNADPLTLEVLVEEPSAKVALDHLVPKIVPDVDFEVIEFRGKTTMLKELPRRFAGYAARVQWERVKVVVVVDRDDDDCVELKKSLRTMASAAGLSDPAASFESVVLIRIIVEELESWFFGDVPALRTAYPRVSESLDRQRQFRDPDGIVGGTWEALGRVLAGHGYHRPRLQKMRLASDVAPHMDIENNRSQSFQVFRDGLRRLVKEGN
ncbi:DUF4276 family protein [Amycolatopsis sp. cmx-8-4]|uniref:DUF4276 family protein n=1 Tax=Amycolatopsis sp. cmx-8-4 TaxID=2790947 RepID=UPI00397876E6